MSELIENCKSWLIPGTKWFIQGYSQSANATGFAIFSLGLMFDAGMATQKKMQKILLTHSHADHTFNIPKVAMNRHKDKNSTTVYCPKSMEAPLKLFCRASQSLNDCVDLLSEDQINTVGVEPGDIITHKNLQIDVIKCYHTVECVGYQISEIKSKLKKEYQGLTTAEIRDLRLSGEKITEKVSQIKFTFLGDTTVEIFKNQNLFLSPVIFVECTVLTQDVSLAQATERGHIHWLQLLPYIAKNPQTMFVIIHLSSRYTEKFAFDVINSHNLPNVHLWSSKN